MQKNILMLLTLICCSLYFPSQSSCAENEILTVEVDQENDTLLRQSSFNTFEKLSESEIITMRLPNNPWNETHFGSSDEETHVITLSYIDDTVYLMSVYNMPNPSDYEDKDSEDEADPDYEQSETDHSTGDDMIIAGYHAESNLIVLDGQAAQEFLYGWAGQTFADTVLAKQVALELHSYAIQSTDHVIVLIVCGPSDQALETKVLEYTESLEIRQWGDL